jgi:hypothetical protein
MAVGVVSAATFGWLFSILHPPFGTALLLHGSVCNGGAGGAALGGDLFLSLKLSRSSGQRMGGGEVPGLYASRFRLWLMPLALDLACAKRDLLSDLWVVGLANLSNRAGVRLLIIPTLLQILKSETFDP